jgi:hypothetical protein
LFVLRHVNRFLCSILREKYTSTNPLHFYAELGSMELVKWDREGPRPSIVNPTIVLDAVKGGNVDVVKYFIENFRIPVAVAHFHIAAIHSSIEVLRYLIRFRRPFIQTNTLSELVVNGNLNVLKFLIDELELEFGNFKEEEGITSCSDEIMEYFATHPKIGGEKFALCVCKVDLIEKYKAKVYTNDKPNSLLLTFGARGGSIPIMRIYHPSNGLLSLFAQETAIAEALKNNNVEVITFARRIRHLDGPAAGVNSKSLFLHLCEAIKKKHWDVLEYCLSVGLILKAEFFTAAVHSGDFALLDLLKELNCPIDFNQAFKAAVESRNSELIDAFIDKVVWDDSANNPTQEVARQGNVLLMKRLAEKGCPIRNGCVGIAASFGHYWLLKYLVEDLSQEINVLVISQVLQGQVIHLDILLYLKERKAKLNGDLVWLVINHRFANLSKKVLDTLLEMGFEFKSEYVEQAREGNHKDVWQWLYRHNCPMSFRSKFATELTFGSSVVGSMVSIVKFLGSW